MRVLIVVLKLLADVVVYPLLPVELAPRDGQLPPQRLEGGVGHGGVVLSQGGLVHVFGVLDRLDEGRGGVLCRLEWERDGIREEDQRLTPLSDTPSFRDSIRCMDIRLIDIRPFRHNVSLYDDCIVAFRPSALHSLFGGSQVSPLRSRNFALALRIVVFVWH